MTSSTVGAFSSPAVHPARGGPAMSAAWVIVAKRALVRASRAPGARSLTRLCVARSKNTVATP
nr:hypothetical protein [Streptomyces katrae]